MKKYLAVPLVLGAIGLAACGGQAQSDSAQIKQVTTQFVEAFSSDSPADGCQYVTDASKASCAKAAITLKMLGGGSLVKGTLPNDWKDRINNAKFTVTGDRAIAPAHLLGKSGSSGTTFQKVDGHWLIAMNGNAS